MIVDTKLRALIIQAYTQGKKSIGDIAKTIGVSRQRIYQILKEEKIPVRSKAEAAQLASKQGKLKFSEDKKRKMAFSVKAALDARSDPVKQRSHEAKLKNLMKARQVKREPGQPAKLKNYIRERLRQENFVVYTSRTDLLDEYIFKSDLFLFDYGIFIHFIGPRILDWDKNNEKSKKKLANLEMDFAEAVAQGNYVFRIHMLFDTFTIVIAERIYAVLKWLIEKVEKLETKPSIWTIKAENNEDSVHGT